MEGEREQMFAGAGLALEAGQWCVWADGLKLEQKAAEGAADGDELGRRGGVGGRDCDGWVALRGGCRSTGGVADGVGSGEGRGDDGGFEHGERRSVRWCCVEPRDGHSAETLCGQAERA